MSKKITKVIAALGVVAGLGIAALPLSSYAETGTVDVKVTVAGNFTITNDDNIATCTPKAAETLQYGAIALSFTGENLTDIVATDDSGICLQSNSKGKYSIAMGTPYHATVDTTTLYSEAASGSEGSALASQKIEAANGPLSAGTAAWGVKFNGANRGAASTTNAINADTEYVAPVEFGTSYSGGRTLGSNVTIPNDVGDYYGITVGAAVTGSHNGQYTGSLVFHAVATLDTP